MLVSPCVFLPASLSDNAYVHSSFRLNADSQARALCLDPGLENLMEHRLGHRLPTHAEIFVRIDAATAISAVMTDISVSGAFVRSESQPAIFSTVWVRWHGR